MFLANLPAPAPGSIETWLLAGAAVLAIIALWKQVFTRHPPIESDLEKLRKENDEKIEKLRKEMADLFVENTRSHGVMHRDIRSSENTAISIREDIRKEMKEDREKAERSAWERVDTLGKRMNDFAENMPLKLIEHLHRLGHLKTPS